MLNSVSQKVFSNSESEMESADFAETAVDFVASMSGRPECHAVEALFPIIYDKLRRVASGRIAGEGAEQSLTATELVHEAFLRLRGGDRDSRFQNTRHLYAAAGEVMRWILIDRARARKRSKRGGEMRRTECVESQLLKVSQSSDDELLAVDDSLKRLEMSDPDCAELVKMRFFSGFTLREIAEATGMSYTTAKRRWGYAKAWLKLDLRGKGAQARGLEPAP